MSNRNFTYTYLRFNWNSIQGRFTYLLSIVAASVGVLLAINYFIIKDQHQRHQDLLEVWLPTQEQLTRISMHVEAGRLDDKALLPLIKSLNSLSDRWQDQRLLITYEKVLEKIELLNRTQAPSPAELQALPEYRDLQEHLARLSNSTHDHIARLSEENKVFAQDIKWLFIWEYLGYFTMGFIACTFITIGVMRKIRVLKRHVAAISNGNLSEKLPLQNDEFNSTATSLNQLIDNLKDITFFAGEVGRGNMDAAMNAFDDKSELGRSLSGMRDSLKRVALEEKNRRWLNEGIATFATITRQHNGNVNDLSTAVIGELVKYVGALQGAIFITHKEGNKTVLRMSGCYAYDRQKYLDKLIPADSGLIGQAYLEKLPKYLREIPKNYETITTGLGQGSPESILMMPLLHEDQVEGVLELASMRQIEEFEMEFLSKIAESLGSTVAAVRISEETRRLLEESQGVAEELRAQEEEMRQNMEEMQATQEEMVRAQRELTIKETNLNAFINNTTDSIITITRNYKVGLINEVLKTRYKGTQYEGIEAGADIMPTLGAVAEEWKGYYDRAFAGEHLDFTIKSSVKGEDSWREYHIHPIRSKHGEIVAVSVISRDSTHKMLLDLKMKQKSAVLKSVLEHSSDGYVALNEQNSVIIASRHLAALLPEFVSSPREEEKLLSLVPADNKAFWNEQLQRAQAGEHLQFTRPLAGDQQVSIRLEPMLDEDKQIGVLMMVNKA
jgi:HAMP domain-containing protein/PAS domain-containing protein